MLRSNNIQQINNKLVYFDKYSTFRQHLEMGLILDDSIVFVGEGATSEDGPFIQTHGKIFGAAGIIEYIHNFVNNNATSINAALAEQLAQLKAQIDAEHKSIMDDANAALDKVKQDLEAAEEKIKWLQEHGSDEDKIEQLAALLHSEIAGLSNALVEYRERISALEGVIEKDFTLTDVDNHIQTAYKEYIDLVKGYVQEELRKINLDEQIVQTVGRYMESGLLKDYVTYALLSDEKTITSFAEQLLKANETFASLEDLVSWRSGDGQDLIETLAALKLYVDGLKSSWLLSAEYKGLNDFVAAILGYADETGSFIDMVASQITFETGKLLFKTNNNNCILIDENGIRHFVDVNGNEIWDGEPTEHSNFFLGADGSGWLGKLSNNIRPIQWDANGNVKIQKEDIYDGNSPFDWDVVGTYIEWAFTSVPDNYTLTSVCLPPNQLWPETGNKELTTVIGSRTYVWTKSALNVQDGEKIWMAQRRVKSDGSLLPNGKSNWEGPYCISGAGGVLGVDDDWIKFIYTRTDSGQTPTIPTSFTSGTAQSGSYTWYDNASDENVTLTKDHTVWMSYSMTKSGSSFTNFVGPILWAQWGHDAIDGDGVQYIFTVTSSDFGTWPSNKQHIYYNNNPSLWPAKGTSQSLGEEFIGDGLDHKNVTWYDNPQELHQGESQWVCVRTYKHSTGWSAYSQPSVWAYYSKDGVTSGYIVDFSNSNIPVTTDVNGFLSADLGAGAEDRYPVFDHTVSLYVYTSVGGNVPIEITEGQDINTSGLRYSAELDPNDAYVAASRPAPADLDNPGEQLTNWFELELSQDTSDDPYHTYIRVIIHNVNEANITDPESLRDKHLYIPVIITIKPDSDPAHNVVIRKELSIYGVYTGADGIPGLTMDLRCDTSTVSRDRYNPASNEPSTVTPYIYFALGTTVYDKMYATYHFGEIFPGGINRSDFVIQYKRGASGTWTTLSGSDTIDTTGNTPLYIGLLYKGTQIDTKVISYVLSGPKGDTVNGIGKFISTVFCRTNETPVAPTGGSWPDGFPDNDQVYKASDNSVIDDVRWHDGLPSGNAKLWASQRVFYSDGSHDNTNPPSWSNPIEMTDIKNLYDVEFSTEETYTDDPDNAPSEWFDPTTKKYRNDSISQPHVYDGDWTDVIWRAEQFIINGDVTDWIITKIKGEKGDPGISPVGKFKSTIFCRCRQTPVAPGWTIDSSTHLPASGEDSTITYSEPYPHGNNAVVKYVVGSGNSATLSDVTPSATWQDGIPDGEYTLWACTGTIVEGTNSTTWSEPKQMTDTETWDVEFCPLEVYSGDPTNYPGEWYDPNDDLSGTDYEWSDMIWRAERSKKNGVWDENWTILRIKGEKGDPSSGYRLEPSRSIVEMSYSEYGDLLQQPTTVYFTLYKDGQITNESWTLNTEVVDTDYVAIDGHSAIIKKVQADANSNTQVVSFWAEDQNRNTIGRADLTLSRKIVAEFEPVVNTTRIIYNSASESCSPNNIIVRLRKTNFVTGEVSYIDFDSDPWDIEINPTLPDGAGDSTSQVVRSLSGVSYDTIKNGVNIIIYNNGTTQYRIDIPVEYNGAAAGTPGKMFYMCGEYSEELIEGTDIKNHYERTSEYIPLVHFTAHGEEKGSWYILQADKNYPGDYTTSQVRYAPGEYSSDGKHYTFVSGVWQKAEQFNVVITEGIFSDFAKFGSAIISGDYIMSKHGRMYQYSDNTLSAGAYINVPDGLGNGVSFKNKEYLYFSPEKQTVHRVSNNLQINQSDNIILGNIIQIPKGCRLKGTVEFKTLVPGLNTQFDQTTFARELYNSGELALIAVDENNNELVDSSNNPIRKSLITNAIPVHETVDGNLHKWTYTINTSDETNWTRYKILLHPVASVGSAINLTIDAKIVHDDVYGVFEPAWCVDLKTGKMIAGGGSFVVEPNGNLSIGEGLVRWQRGAFNQLSFHNGTDDDAQTNVVISADQDGGNLGGTVIVKAQGDSFKSSGYISSLPQVSSMQVDTKYKGLEDNDYNDFKRVQINSNVPNIIVEDASDSKKYDYSFNPRVVIRSDGILIYNDEGAVRMLDFALLNTLVNNFAQL